MGGSERGQACIPHDSFLWDIIHRQRRIPQAIILWDTPLAANRNGFSRISGARMFPARAGLAEPQTQEALPAAAALIL